MSNRPTLPDFIDDELLRAPMTIDLVIDTVLQLWRARMLPTGRHDADPARVLSRAPAATPRRKASPTKKPNKDHTP